MCAFTRKNIRIILIIRTCFQIFDIKVHVMFTIKFKEQILRGSCYPFGVGYFWNMLNRKPGTYWIKNSFSLSWHFRKGSTKISLTGTCLVQHETCSGGFNQSSDYLPNLSEQDYKKNYMSRLCDFSFRIWVKSMHWESLKTRRSGKHL